MSGRHYNVYHSLKKACGQISLMDYVHVSCTLPVHNSADEMILASSNLIKYAQSAVRCKIKHIKRRCFYL